MHLQAGLARQSSAFELRSLEPLRYGSLSRDIASRASLRRRNSSVKDLFQRLEGSTLRSVNLAENSLPSTGSSTLEDNVFSKTGITEAVYENVKVKPYESMTLKPKKTGERTERKTSKRCKPQSLQHRRDQDQCSLPSRCSCRRWRRARRAGWAAPPSSTTSTGNSTRLSAAGPALSRSGRRTRAASRTPPRSSPPHRQLPQHQPDQVVKRQVEHREGNQPDLELEALQQGSELVVIMVLLLLTDLGFLLPCAHLSACLRGVEAP